MCESLEPRGDLKDIYKAPEVICKMLGPANTVLKEKNRVGRLILPDVKTYSKAIVLKTM